MIVHIAGVPLSQQTGMGRIALEWSHAFERKGYEFKHIATGMFPNRKHRLLDGWLARRFIKSQGWKPSLIIAHEPLAGWLKWKDIPLVTFSHGIEERGTQQQQQYKYGFQVNSKKAAFLPNAIRYWAHDKGFRTADLRLLSNKTDWQFLLQQKHCNKPAYIFRNGYYPFELRKQPSNPVCLFNATWLPRKGIAVLVYAFNIILRQHPEAQLLLAGTGLTSHEILEQFNPEIRIQVEVIPSFECSREAELYGRANIFILPSYFEGQSLALTQAMAMGLCPVAADNSGQVDMIRHDDNGLLFRTGDASDLMAKLAELFADPEKLKRLQLQAAQSVSHLTWSKVADDVADKCLSLI